MSREEKLSAPPTMAGLVRYEEGEESLVRIKPHTIIGFCILLLVLEIILQRLL